MSPFARARSNMVDGQLRPNKVTDDRLLAAMGDLPREDFVPDLCRNTAYVDEGVDLGGCRYLLEPMILARLIQEAGIKPTDVVLDIGAATGYGAAVLSRMAATVVAVEEVPALAYAAIANLQKVGADNAVVITGPLADGSAKQAPYDVILIEGGISEEPATLLAQLSEGGRLLAVEMRKGPVGVARLWEKQGASVSSRILFDAGVKVLPGFAPQPGFVF